MIINQSLFGSKINKETTLGTDGHFLSPFGPQFLYLTLDDEIRLKLLQSVANFRKDTSQLNPRVFLKYADLGYKAQKNSITDGEIYIITGLDPYVDDIISRLVEVYGANYLDVDPEKPEINKKLNFTFSAVWFGIMKQGDFHMIHGHKDNVIRTLMHEANVSGAIYLDVPEDLQYPQGVISWIHSGSNEELSNSLLEASPKSGEVYVWPSWVQHLVYPFKGKGERIMISFNGYWEIIRDDKSDETDALGMLGAL